MPITGIAELLYAVEDLEKSIRFFDDFGLPLLERGDDYARFEVESGQQVVIYALGDPRVPKSELRGQGVHQCTWAVPDAEILQRLVDSLSVDHEVTIDGNGAAHFITPWGQAMAIKVFNRRPLNCQLSPTNGPGIINRMNAPRRWASRAIPRNINHVVWGVHDVNAVKDYYCDRLGFRLSDAQKGIGFYVRGGGSTNHHNVAIADCRLELFGFSSQFEFHHANFGVVDMDEIMAGKAYLERRGYDTGKWGLGRHRISSELFLYVPCPAGGEAEYGADCDQIDDQWRPRLWGAAFAAFNWTHDMPEWFRDNEPEWDLTFATPENSVHKLPED